MTVTPRDLLPPEVAAALSEASLDANEEVPESSGLEATVTKMIRWQEEVDALEAALSDAKRQLDEVRKNELPAKMQELGLVQANGKASFTHSSGANVHLRTRVWAHIRKDDQDVTFAWLREHGHADLIKEVVNAQTLSATVKEWMEDGTPLPPGVQTSVETIAVVIKPKGGSAS